MAHFCAQLPFCSWAYPALPRGSLMHASTKCQTLYLHTKWPVLIQEQGPRSLEGGCQGPPQISLLPGHWPGT